jgi:hypothetical protein
MPFRSLTRSESGGTRRSAFGRGASLKTRCMHLRIRRDAAKCVLSAPDPFSRRVLRVSMGSILTVPSYVSDRLGEILDKLVRTDELELMGAVTDPTAEPFDRALRPAPAGLGPGRRRSRDRARLARQMRANRDHTHAPRGQLAQRGRCCRDLDSGIDAVKTGAKPEESQRGRCTSSRERMATVSGRANNCDTSLRIDLRQLAITILSIPVTPSPSLNCFIL